MQLMTSTNTWCTYLQVTSMYCPIYWHPTSISLVGFKLDF